MAFPILNGQNLGIEPASYAAKAEGHPKRVMPTPFRKMVWTMTATGKIAGRKYKSRTSLSGPKRPLGRRVARRSGARLNIERALPILVRARRPQELPSFAHKSVDLGQGSTTFSRPRCHAKLPATKSQISAIASAAHVDVLLVPPLMADRTVAD